MSDLYSFNSTAFITVSGKNYEFYGVLGFTTKFGEVPRLLQVRCFRFCILLQVSHTTISRSHDVRQMSSLRFHVSFASANERESYFADFRICRSQNTKKACMNKLICFRKGGRHRQPRHRARKKRKYQILRKSCVCVALNREDYRSNEGWLWMG